MLYSEEMEKFHYCKAIFLRRHLGTLSATVLDERGGIFSFLFTLHLTSGKDSGCPFVGVE